ncbi:MAG: hypothetical protein ACREJ9_07470 [Candidatus Rokuibacteriota bacterium]
MAGTRDIRSRVASSLEAVPTRELLALFERHFGRLDPKTKARILEISRSWGSGEAWSGMDGLAA